MFTVDITNEIPIEHVVLESYRMMVDDGFVTILLSLGLIHKLLAATRDNAAM